jgi:probable lipoprotein NlpC
MNKGIGQNFNNRFLGFVFLLVIGIAFSSCSSSKKIRKQNVESVISTAKSYRGTPYRYGGTTRSGIDCSALIFHAYNSVGYQLPRTSAEQSKLGKKVSENKLREGDVVFFATSKSRRKVTHSGIVTEVSSRGVYFIHSSTSLGVTEDNLSNNYWNKAFRFGRRVL